MGGYFYVIACISLISVFRMCSTQETFVRTTCSHAKHAGADFRSNLLLQIRESLESTLGREIKDTPLMANTARLVQRIFHLLNDTKAKEGSVSQHLLLHFIELQRHYSDVSIYLNEMQKKIDTDEFDSILEWRRNVSQLMAVLIGSFRDAVSPGNRTGGQNDESMIVRALEQHMARLAEKFENISLSRHLGLVSNSADHWLSAMLNATVSSTNSCSRIAGICEGANVRLADETSNWRDYTAHQWQIVMKNINYTFQYQSEQFYLRLKDLIINGLTDMQLSIANVSAASLAASYGHEAHENLRNESEISTWRNNVSEYMSRIVDTQRDNKGMLLQLMQTLEAWKANLSLCVNTQGNQQSTTDVVEEIKLAYERALPRTGFRQVMRQMKEINIYMSPSSAAVSGRDYYAGCQDARNHGHTRAGVYHIGQGRPEFRVWCEFDGNVGWAVIQRRFDGSVDFLRNFQDYTEGFGNLWGEYWLGLKHIYRLSERGTSLSIYMETFQHQQIWANYSSFRVSNGASFYRLNVSGYSGTDRDSLSNHNGMAFSTWDQDRDTNSGNCALAYYGAWWYNNCHQSNLNGKYAGLAHGSTACSWYSAGNEHVRLMLTRMMVKW